jgi:hypothetical protein
VPSLAAAYRVAKAAKALAFELPWSEAVLRALETAAARRPGGGTAPFVARTLSIELGEATKNLDALCAAGAVERAGDRFVVRGTSSVDTQGGGKEAVSRIKRHWSAVAAERTAAPRAEDFLAYNVISLSRRDLALARAKLQATFRELRALVATSTPEEVVAVVNLQLIAFDPDR